MTGGSWPGDERPHAPSSDRQGGLTGSCGRQGDLAAYVLGALEPAERSAFEAHLPSCERCRAESTEFAGLPGLLGRLSAADAAAVSTPEPADDEAALNRLLAHVAARRRARRRRNLLSVAAAVVLLAGAGAGIAAGVSGSAGGGREISATQGAVHATVRLDGSAAGTEIALDLQGVRPDEHCRLVAVAKDGSTADAGSWVARYDGWAGVHGVTSIARSDLASLRVEDASGATLVAIPVGS